MSRDKYEEQLQKKLHDLEVEVDRLQAHIKAMSSELEAEHHKKFADLRDLHARTRHAFHQLLNASDKKFESAKSNLEGYWNSLGREIKAYDRKLKE